MISYNTVQQAIADSTTKHISWLFDVETFSPDNSYYWSTKVKSFKDYTSYLRNDYTFKIIPDSFSGLSLNRAKPEYGIQTPNEIIFQVTNSGLSLTASDFVDGLLLVRLIGSKYSVTELLTNTGFETYTGTPNDSIEDSFTGWTISGTNGYVDAITISPHSGSACIKIRSGAAADKQIKQTIAVTAEEHYSFSFFAKTGGTLNPGRYAIYDNSNGAWIVSATSNVGNTSDTIWSYIKVDFTTPAGCTSIDLILLCDSTASKNVFYDDVSLTYAEVELRAQAFSITRCESFYQTLTFTCEDILQKYVKGDYPKKGLVKNLFKTNGNLIDDDYCLPESFGTTYIPLRLIVNSPGNDYYLLGPTTNTAGAAVTYTVNKQRVPRGVEVGKYEWSSVSWGTSIILNGTFDTDLTSWTSGSFFWSWSGGTALHSAGAGHSAALQQTSTTVVVGTTYKLEFDIVGMTAGSITPSCGGVTDATYSSNDTNITFTFVATATTRPQFTPTDAFDGAIDNVTLQPTVRYYTFTQSTLVDDTSTNRRVFVNNIDDGNNQIYVNGEHWFDVPTEFTRSDRTSTAPEDIINDVFDDLKGSNYDILSSTSLSTAGVTYTTWNLVWNGGLYKAEPTEKIIGKLLNMCHSTITSNGLYADLKVLSKTSQKTITKADVLKTSDQGQGTFKYSAITKEVYDSGYVAYQEFGEAQDEFIQILVPTKEGGTTANPSNEMLELPFIGDSVTAQKLGILYFQRKYLKMADISFSAKGTLLALQPDDVITINDTDYGGSYDVLVDSIAIKKDLTLELKCIRFSQALDDYTDLSPSVITPSSYQELQNNIRNYAAPERRLMEHFAL